MKFTLLSTLLAACTGLTATAQTAATARTFDPPVMGWSSWNTFYANINETIVKGQADAIVSKGLLACGYNYINIDDGFQWDRDESGRLQVNPTRFPNGLKPVVDYIHAKGLKAGIYSDAGHSTCASYYNGETHELQAGMLDHDDEDSRMYFNELEFDFIKVDFCGGTAHQNQERLDLNAEERYKAIAAAIRRTGRKVNFNVCRWDFPGTWVRDIADSWRTTQDINASWGSIKNIIGQNLYLSAYCGGGHYNDMDMLEVGRGLSAIEERTHLGMWSIMSSPLLIGCDLRNIPSATLNLLRNTELIALNQDPLGLQAYVVRSEGGCYVLVKDIETLHGTKRAVAFYNPTDAAQTIGVTFEEVELAGNVAIRNILDRTDVSNSDPDGYSASVPAHGTLIMTFTADRRLDRTRYEAETAYLSSYQEIMNNQTAQTGIYDAASYCSGGMKAGWLGMRAANDLQWQDVYVSEAGDYRLDITYISGENRNLSIDVNGAKATTLSCNSGGWSTTKTASIRVHLNAGSNVVRLYNASAWMPDIDCMTVKLLQADAIHGVVADASAAAADSPVYSLQGQHMGTAADLPALPNGIYVSSTQKILKHE